MVVKGKGNEWMGFLSSEKMTSGWECREWKWRGVDGSVEKGKGDVCLGV